MADLPLACNVQGDYGYKVVVVDDGDTIEEVIHKATDQIVGVLVKPFPPGTVLEARIHGADNPLSKTTTVKQANLAHMEAINICQEG
jgi:hypothetical protein